MYRQTSLLKFIIINTITIMVNSINVYARSIDTEVSTESSSGTILKVPSIVCIIGVVAVVASGGFCLFSSKKQKRMSEEYLNKVNSNSNTSSTTSSPISSNSELHQLNPEIEEADIAVQVDKLDNNKLENENNLNQEKEGETQKKRKSFLDTLLRNSKRDSNKQNIQLTEDRSLNSISTNEDWIAEQKYQAGLKNDDLYEEEEEFEETNSNDGFWNSDLEPIQSSSNNKQESYAIPSLGKSNSVIVKRNSEINGRHQSVIILDDNNNKINSSGSSVGSKKSIELRPTRVKSWKNNDLNKEINELMKSIEEQEKLENIKE